MYLLFTGFSFFLVGKYFAMQLIAALVIIYIAAVGIRTLYFKDRPSHEPHKNFFERIDASSFPSIHAARASAVAYLVASWAPETTIIAVLVAILVCASRLYLRKHFVIDILGGIAIGIITAMITARII